jgi:hypothetical protein
MCHVLEPISQSSVKLLGPSLAISKTLGKL